MPVEAITVALVYLNDALRDSDIASVQANGEDLDLWNTNSKSLRTHIAALTQLLEQGHD